MPPAPDGPSNPVEAIVRALWTNRYGRFLVLAVGALALYALVVVSIDQIGIKNVARESDPFPTSPVVITIQPDIEGVDGDQDFGDLHIQGLKEALPANVADLKLVRASATEMKNRQLDAMFEKLDEDLARRNVVAVVGPSITECTPDVIRYIHKAIPELPIIIESSAAEGDAFGSGAAGASVFRLSSGVDRRGQDTATAIADLIKGGVRVGLIVEQLASKERSYGEFISDYAKEALRSQFPEISWSTIRQLSVRRHHLHAARDEIEELVQKSDVVFFLGLARDFHELVSAYCAPGAPGPVKFVGIMNAHFVDADLRNGVLNPHCVIDITDMAFETTLNPQSRMEDFLGAFAGPSAKMSPALRDQAFSFDAGLLISHALESLDADQRLSLSYTDGLKAIASAIRSVEMDGVTGPISFKDSGQSRIKELRLCAYRPANHEWVTVSLDDLRE